MKTIKYTCDNSDCTKQTNDIESDKWLEIGSNNNTLKVNNFFKDRKLISLGRYTDIHFCSSECFINKFVDGKANL